MTLQPIAILFPDAELWAIGRLRTALAARSETYVTGVKVSNAVPDPRPARLVTIRRDGGASDGLFDRPRLGVNVWAGTEQDCANLTRLVMALLFVVPGDGVCVAIRQAGGPSPVPDVAPRRFMTFEATLRGPALA
jgi:hypothetical protein